MSFARTLSKQADQIEVQLANLFAAGPAASAPPRLRDAMQHALLAGGKRLRPFLVLESAALFEVSPEQAMSAACAMECVHCYSLVHDDLPAMDNDEMRRGRPTVWKAYDDWTAILAGDALLTMAFELLAHPSCHPDPSVRSELTLRLSSAAGAGGMVGGQALDLQWEKIDTNTTASTEDITSLQAMKTGALITCACEMGAILARAPSKDQQRLRRYGQVLGAAFQIADDLLDAEGDAAIAGKAVAKDNALGKATLVQTYGIEHCRKLLLEMQNECRTALSDFGPAAETLIAASQFVATRDR